MQFPDRTLCFFDVDTLVIKSLDSFIDPKVDIIYTWKNELYPINTGVMLVRNGYAVQRFFEDWIAMMTATLRDRDATRSAQEFSGAVDQHTLRELIGFVNYDKEGVYKAADYEIRHKGINCELLNEVNCRPITDRTHVIHYKGGWHPILLEKHEFSSNRPQQTCEEMYMYWTEWQTASEARLAQNLVMNSAAEHLNEFEEVLVKYEERGILNSEMLAVCSVCDELNVDIILESGRARGHSTMLLARYFRDKPVRIVSFELSRDLDAEFAERRLRSYTHLDLRYGDSMALIPTMVRELRNSGHKIALLIDGPKGRDAVELIELVLRISPDVVAVFVHDARKPSPARPLMEQRFLRLFFTDHDNFHQTFGELDKGCLPREGQDITDHTWRPFMKGNMSIDTYGPTLALMFPIGPIPHTRSEGLLLIALMAKSTLKRVLVSLPMGRRAWNVAQRIRRALQT